MWNTSEANYSHITSILWTTTDRREGVFHRITSNQSFGSWGEVFGDRIIATAILDRILHYAIILNIRGNSYRLKDELKAGLVRPAEAME